MSDAPVQHPLSPPQLPFVVAITGASGAVYAQRLVQVLLNAGRQIHLTISPAGAQVLEQEIGVRVDLDAFSLDQLLSGQPPADQSPPLVYHHYLDLMAPIASGSFRTAAMVVCPCSGSTLAAVVTAGGSNLIHRACEVHLKERRPLVLVPRETPLSLAQLDNMRAAHLGGATVLPAAPGWYHGVQQLGDLVDFVVARILDHLNVEHSLVRRWGNGE